MEDSIRLWIAVAPPQLEELRTLQRISPDIYTSRIDLSATQMYWRKFRKVSSVGMDFFFLKNMMGKEGCFIGSSIRWLSMSQFVNVLIETEAWVSCRLVYFRSLGSAVWVVAKWWKVRFECVQSVIGTFQYFDAVMLQECGMQSCGISILNETKQTKRNKQMKHKQFWVFCAMLLVLQLGFCLSVCQLASAIFAKMTCWRVLAKPRRQVHFQNTCMPVNRFDFEFVLHTAGSAQWTHENSFWLVLGMVTVLAFCREGQSVFPVLLCWKWIQTLVACWDMCYWFAKFRYVGSIWNFGKQSC